MNQNSNSIVSDHELNANYNELVTQTGIQNKKIIDFEK